MDIFGNLKQQIKIRQVYVDDKVFQLHYRVTAILLFGCAALVASKQHFGDPIDCITRDDVPNKIMDTYCWIHSTFTLPDACNKTVGIEVAHPCVDKSETDKAEYRLYHKYYQWVYFVLFFQAIAFYAPHYIWKSYESKLLSKLVEDLKSPLKEQTPGRVFLISRYLTRMRMKNDRYLWIYATCELMNFVNVLLQIYVVDEFLGETFTTYGLDVIKYAQMDQEIRTDPMSRVFPKMTKCTFHRFGSSGDVQRHDALCILPLNILNEKIYIIMWFWFVFLAIVSGLWLIYRILTITQLNIRYQALMRRATYANRDQVKYILKNSKPGNWFLLHMICYNVDGQWFSEIIKKTCDLIKNPHKMRRRPKPKKELQDISSLISDGPDSESKLDGPESIVVERLDTATSQHSEV